MFNIHEIYLNGGKGQWKQELLVGGVLVTSCCCDKISWLEQLKGEGFVLACNARLCPSCLESHGSGSCNELVILCPQLGSRIKVLACNLGALFFCLFLSVSVSLSLSHTF